MYDVNIYIYIYSYIYTYNITQWDSFRKVVLQCSNFPNTTSNLRKYNNINIALCLMPYRQ